MQSVEIDSYEIKAGQRGNVKTALLISVLFTLVLLVNEPIMSAAGLGWCLFLFLLFVIRLGQGFPVLELMLLMAALQWIVGAKISYVSEFEHFRYYMYVPEGEYMQLVVPGVIALSLGVLIFFPKYSFEQVNYDLRKLMVEQKNIAYILIAIGLLSTYAVSYIPSVLRFVLYLTASFQFVGLGLLLFQPHSKTKWRWFILIMGGLTISSIKQGMFHDLLLWSALLFSIVIIQLKIRFFGKLSLIFMGFMMAFLLQSIKADFRSQLGDKTTVEKIILFTGLIQESAEFGETKDEETTTEMAILRLNQGWIITAILDNMPANEPFVGGETVIEAIKSSLLPRFLYPNKKEAGGRENFRKFTGLPINDGTSMGSSVIGEAYANFGMEGAWIFMFLWGAFLAWGFSKLVKYGQKHPVIFAFIPLIFLQVIKAETELVVVLNHFIKSLILVFGFLWAARRLLHWQV